LKEAHTLCVAPWSGLEFNVADLHRRREELLENPRVLNYLHGGFAAPSWKKRQFERCVVPFTAFATVAQETMLEGLTSHPTAARFSETAAPLAIPLTCK
jgi:hypothetical protein